MKNLPKTGLYVSTRKVDGLRLVVEDVYGPEDEDFVDDGEFYIVNVIDENGQDVFELVPLNDDYPTMHSDRQHIQIIGVMVEHRSYRKRQTGR